jgi:hypothetical protein
MITLFSVVDNINAGYTSFSVSNDSIIGNGRTIKVLLLPGQEILISYGNSKCFVLLPSRHTDSISVGDTIIDADSVDCADMIYDGANGVIISAEKTISETCFLQILDIYGTKISILKSKKLGSVTIIPLGLSYNIDTDKFILIYTDSMVNSIVKAQVFNNDGEQILLGLTYNTMVKYNSDLEVCPIHNVIFKLLKGMFGVAIVSNGLSLSYFDDDYGVQPNNYIGIIAQIVENKAEVVLKGHVFNSNILLPSAWAGKKVYLDSNCLYKVYPNNLTINSISNMFVGTVLTVNKILVGI